MRQIKLTQGKFALVDNKDFDWLNQWKWCAVKGGKTYYAVRGQLFGKRHDNKIKIFFMHREILNPPKNKQVDHKDRDGLNNQKYNIRKCSKAQNTRNRGLHKNNTSGYKGVYWKKRNKKWISQITVNGNPKYLGCFDNIIDAAHCYNKNALKYHGEFASLNFK